MTCVIYSDKGSQGLCQNTFTCMLEIVMMTECLLLGGKKKVLQDFNVFFLVNGCKNCSIGSKILYLYGLFVKANCA